MEKWNLARIKKVRFLLSIFIAVVLVLLQTVSAVVCADSINGKSTEAKVSDSLKDIKDISAGIGHTVALKNKGKVVAWGGNYFGQCNVPNGLTGIKQVSAGANHTIALKEDGTVVVWGNIVTPNI